MNVMKAICRSACAVALFILSLLANDAQVQAATQYFDTNGATAGSGITADGSYSWEDSVWNTVGVDDADAAANGTLETSTWVDGNFPRFAAGVDAAGLTYTVTASSNHTFAGMQLLINTSVNGGATVNVNSSGGAVLSIAPALQGLFVSTGGNLKINAPLGGADATSALQWSGGGGSAYLYGANTFEGGVILNTANGLNFNNSQSFGTGPITYTTINTAVLANPDTTAPVTINNPLTMPAQTTANKTMIYTGHDPVTFTNWTLGDSPAGIAISNVLTVGNTPFPSAKLIINNLAGTANSNLTVSSSAGVNGTLVLTGTSTYGGAANGGITTIGTNTTGNPALQADDGTGLPTNSLLLLNGGVLQTSGNFTRPLVGGFGQNMAWNVGGGGFSAIDSQLTVNIGGAGDQLAWGDSTLTTDNPDLGSKVLGPLKFGSVSSNAKTLFVNPIDLNPAAAANPARTITVTGGAGGDSTELSGEISSSADPDGTPATLTKTGTGTLILSGANTYAGLTTISAGKLLANNASGSATGTGPITISSGATLGGTGSVNGPITNNGIIAPGAGVGTLSVVGDVTNGENSSWSIELGGASADKLAVTGNINLSATDSLDITGTGTGTSWIIGTYTGSLTGIFDTVTPGYTVSYTGGNITLNAAAGIAGDFNNDGKVDAGDYVTWRKNDGTNNALPNDNGLSTPIRAAHYDLWRANFGKPTPGAGSSLDGAAVPEPSSLALLMLALATLASARRKR